ncbi:cytochrome c peroxidase [Tundrisphaera lichenicola]|uniref:cytochrome c peroxidase n=1 Tax=Tundrisphaera lichenicola TaxID=2029860 RepID=UPI003EB99992
MIEIRTTARLVAAIVGAACVASEAGELTTRLRQPVAMAASLDGGSIYVANRRSGTISVVDPKLGRVVREVEAGRGLADLALLPDGRHLAVVDRAGDSLVILKVDGTEVAVESRLPVAPDPVSVVLKPDGSGVVVASTASRKLSMIGWADRDETISPEIVGTVDLPFSPRLMVWAGSKLVVADAFGGRLAVVDPASGRVESSRSIPGHNIRGLAVSPNGRSLVLAHQVLNRLARSSFEDIHWGTLLTNDLRIVRLDTVLSVEPEVDLLKGSRLSGLGQTGRGSGDPGAIAFAGEGRLFAVVLSGVGEVAFGRDPAASLRRVAVGQMPTSLLTDPDGSIIYAADAMDDTIGVVDVASGKLARSISLGPRPELGPVERGERLFFDARVSHDGWLSCHSCHTDGQSNGLLADTLGDDGFGAPKRISSLMGVGTTGPWTWTGSMDRLEDQVRKSIETSMRGRPPAEDQVADLVAYLRSLPSPRPIGTVADEDSIARGRQSFQSRRCADCHAGPEFTEAGSFDVGLVDEAGHRKFNPPSLRGVGGRTSFLHDGRAASLSEVFSRHRHPRESGWSYSEVEDLVAYLRTL